MKSILLSALTLVFSLTAFGQSDSRLANTSARGMLGAGQNVLISGFVVDAPPGELRWILTRVLGPSLQPFGIQNPVSNPSVTLYNQSGHAIATNASYQDAPNLSLLTDVSALMGALPLSSNMEAATLIGVPAGAYTAVARGENGATGVALLEVWDAGPVGEDMASQSISGLAASTPGLSTLATALRLTGLDAVLSSGGPYTVFAPTDAAFAALPAGTLEALIANPTQLANVLLFHVASGNVRSTNLSNGQQVTTLLTGARTLPVVINDSGVSIGGARVVMADVPALNGVVHVIDAVLVP